MSYKILFDQKVVTALLDGVITLILYFVGKYAGASVFDDVKVVIGVMQPIFLLIIVGLYQTEQAILRSGGFPKFMHML